MKRHAVARAMAAAMLASTLLAGLAAANPPPAHGGEKAKGGDSDAAVTSRSMEAPYLAVPVVRNGELVNYLFVSIRIEVAPGVDLWRTRERAQFLRDALVRASHANDLSDPNDVNALNEARAIAVYRQAAVASLGQQAVGAVTIVSTYSSQGGGV